MKSSISIAVMGFALFMGCAMENQEPLPDDDPATAAAQQASEVRPSARTWHRGDASFCFEVFSQACTDELPVNQCYEAVEGQPCFRIPSYCNQVEEPYRFRFHFFHCL